MSNTNAPTAGKKSPQDRVPQHQIEASTAAAAARTAEAEALLQSQYRALAINSFAAASGLGLAPPSVINPLMFQQELIRRQELERTLAGTDIDLDMLSRRENELIRLRNAHNQIMGAKLVARSTQDRMAVAGIGGGLGLSASEAVSLGLGSSLGHSTTERVELLRASQQHMSHVAARHAAQITASEVLALSAAERDMLSKIADETYRTAISAHSLSTENLVNSKKEKKIWDKDLAYEAELHDNVQRCLMEQEAIAEQQKKQASVSSRTQALMAGAGLDIELAELLRLRQQEELFRLTSMQQFQLPGEDRINLQSRMNNAINMAMTNPYAMLGINALPQMFPNRAAVPMVDPRIVGANIEKAYTAEGTPENNIISKFLNIVTNRVPEIMDMLPHFFPLDLVDNPEKFRAEFPRFVETTLAELTIIQDRASKENGYKSRGLYDRVTNCIEAIAPYRNVTADAKGVVAVPSLRVAQRDNDDDINDAVTSKATTKSENNAKPKRAVIEFYSSETWTCHKCNNDNMSSKSRCSTCQGWKGGVRENKPKKRKQGSEASEEKITEENKAEYKKKRKSINLQDDKQGSKTKSSKSPYKLSHVLFKKRNGKSPNSQSLSRQSKSASRVGNHENEAETSLSDKKVKANEKCGNDQIDAANSLLEFMGGSSTSE